MVRRTALQIEAVVRSLTAEAVRDDMMDGVCGWGLGMGLWMVALFGMGFYFGFIFGFILEAYVR